MIWRKHNPKQYVVDTVTDLAEIHRPRTGSLAFVIAGGTSWLFNGSTWTGAGGGASSADAVSYDPTDSGLASTDVQGALDEVAAGGVPAGLPVYIAHREGAPVDIGPGEDLQVRTDSVDRDDLGIEDGGPTPSGGYWLGGGYITESLNPNTGTVRAHLRGGNSDNELGLNVSGGHIHYPLGPAGAIGLVIPAQCFLVNDGNTSSYYIHVVNEADDTFTCDAVGIWLIKLL